jgi:hypothetical protein
VRVRVNDSGNVFFFSAREPEAEALLNAGMATPLGRPGKRIRCLQLSCSRKQAWTFLRGGRSVGQSSKTFRIERVGDQRHRLFVHDVERCLSFRPEMSVTAAPEEPSTELETQPEIELAVHPEERGLAGKKEGEGVTMPADLETPTRLCEARSQPEHTTQVATPLAADPSDITGHRRLAQAVILQAIEDKASNWFFSSYSKQSFEFWCAVGGLDPGVVKRKAMTATS